MSMISRPDPIEQLPHAFRARARQLWETFQESSDEAEIPVPDHPELLQTLHRVWAYSDFVAQSCIRDPALLNELLTSGDLFIQYTHDACARRLHTVLAGTEDEAQLMRKLRDFRRREMVRIAWRDLAGWATVFETMEELSSLAAACLNGALEHLDRWQRSELGIPRDARGRAQTLAVIAMGKLGAHELNFSSDIDLMFAYAEEGVTGNGDEEVANEEYFTRLGQRLIHVLNAVTDAGFVFRVDMRLRPFGDAGPLAVSVDAMEDYYQTHGREWERYAMIKAAPVAGDVETGRDLMRRLRPFVYRRYLDFGAFESLRHMKELIAREVRRKSLEDNIKLGAGGIREVEFIGQAFQLIRGGREPALRERTILKVLDVLAGSGLLPDFVVDELKKAYVFLRRAENCLQMHRDEQVHALPKDETEQLRLAHAMGFTDWSGFEATLRRHMQQVHNHFQQVFAAPQTGRNIEAATDLASVWEGNVDSVQAEAALQDNGYKDPGQASERIQRLRESYAYRMLSTPGRERMDRLMPLVLGAVGAAEDPEAVLPRVLDLIEHVAQRTAYLALLVENPMALSQLVKLCAASPWIARLLAQHPLLLDELLDPRALYAPLGREDLETELDRRLGGIERDDLEQQMDALRHFKQASILRVAAADVNGSMPLMVVSDHLTEIAEVVLQRVLRVAWDHLVAKHGAPECSLDGQSCDTGFAVIGYGKLGGIELGYGSDLDLVFLYAGDEQGSTAGSQPLEIPVFYARLAQRMIHILNVFTPAGMLYEVDTRLRPSGASGLLVSSLGAFADYQHTAAWTWEHQALVRARAVAGDPLLVGRFEEIRRNVLMRPRETGSLREDVRDMRERMRAELGTRRGALFDLKQDRGGIADIEFMVQYMVLRWACEYPTLVAWTDNIRLLEAIGEARLLDRDSIGLLAEAYRAYRGTVHRLTLQEQETRVSETEFREFRDGVSRLWARMLEKSED